jgi:hypothetical protein
MQRSSVVRLLWRFARALLIAAAILLLAGYFSRYVREASGNEVVAANARKNQLR